jgi:hypothetical protein
VLLGVLPVDEEHLPEATVHFERNKVKDAASVLELENSKLKARKTHPSPSGFFSSMQSRLW